MKLGNWTNKLFFCEFSAIGTLSCVATGRRGLVAPTWRRRMRCLPVATGRRGLVAPTWRRRMRCLPVPGTVLLWNHGCRGRALAYYYVLLVLTRSSADYYFIKVLEARSPNFDTSIALSPPLSAFSDRSDLKILTSDLAEPVHRSHHLP
jgi:hypothetical protein